MLNLPWYFAIVLYKSQELFFKTQSKLVALEPRFLKLGINLDIY
jgi:hypothetical protein